VVYSSQALEGGRVDSSRFDKGCTAKDFFLIVLPQNNSLTNWQKSAAASSGCEAWIEPVPEGGTAYHLFPAKQR
jgi:hypothetical protein